MRSRTVAAVLSLSFLAAAPVPETTPPPAEFTPVTHLAGAELTRLLEALKNQNFADFAAFLRAIESKVDSPDATSAALRYLTGRREFKGNEATEIYRLFGVYVRLRFQKELMGVLERLVNIPTALQPDVPQHENPEIIRLGRHLGELAAEYGLQFRNVDDRIYEITLPPTGGLEPATRKPGSEAPAAAAPPPPGETPAAPFVDVPVEHLLGIYTHGDVVPATPSAWVLPDGSKLDPYRMTVRDGLIYGRGTEDDKCSIVSALLVLRAIRDAGFKLRRGVRLIVETTEETSGAGIEYYKSKYALPPYNVVLDSSYPVVVAEDGYGRIDLTVSPPEDPDDDEVEILDMTGGTANNQIPEVSVVNLRGPDLHELKKTLDDMTKAFVAAHPGANGQTFSIETRIIENTLQLTVRGKSAHSASPESGINPLARAFVLLHEASKKIDFNPSAYLSAAQVVAERFGTGYLGEPLGVAYSDPLMGPLLVSVTTVEKTKDGKAVVGVNLRNPRGKEPKALEKEIIQKLGDYAKKSGIPLKTTAEVADYMIRDPKGPWVATLLDVFGTVTGLESKPVSQAGSTTAKFLPNGLNFGPSLPGEKYMGHNELEFKKLSNLLLDVQLFSEAFLRLANLEKME